MASGLTQQSYLKSCVLSKPIKKIDFSMLNECSKKLTGIQNILSEQLAEVENENDKLMGLYILAYGELNNLWHTLNELLLKVH